jgi:hypothetical protein
VPSRVPAAAKVLITVRPRGSRSRNKVIVGEPAFGSLRFTYKAWVPLGPGWQCSFGEVLSDGSVVRLGTLIRSRGVRTAGLEAGGVRGSARRSAIGLSSLLSIAKDLSSTQVSRPSFSGALGKGTSVQAGDGGFPLGRLL